MLLFNRFFLFKQLVTNIVVLFDRWNFSKQYFRKCMVRMNKKL